MYIFFDLSRYIQNIFSIKWKNNNKTKEHGLQFRELCWKYENLCHTCWNIQKQILKSSQTAQSCSFMLLIKVKVRGISKNGLVVWRIILMVANTIKNLTRTMKQKPVRNYTYNRHKISVTLATNNGATLLHIVICARTNSWMMRCITLVNLTYPMYHPLSQKI